MDIAFAGMKVVVPDGWNNESTLVFTMPPRPAPAAPGRPPVKAPTGSVANVAVTWRSCDGMTAAQYLDKRLPSILAGLPACKLDKRGQDGERVEFAEYTLSAQAPLKQLMAVCRVGEQLVCVTGTALAQVFPHVREQFLTTARSLGNG